MTFTRTHIAAGNVSTGTSCRRLWPVTNPDTQKTRGEQPTFGKCPKCGAGLHMSGSIGVRWFTCPNCDYKREEQTR